MTLSWNWAGLELHRCRWRCDTVDGNDFASEEKSQGSQSMWLQFIFADNKSVHPLSPISINGALHSSLRGRLQGQAAQEFSGVRSPLNYCEAHARMPNMQFRGGGLQPPPPLCFIWADRCRQLRVLADSVCFFRWLHIRAICDCIAHMFSTQGLLNFLQYLKVLPYSGGWPPIRIPGCPWAHGGALDFDENWTSLSEQIGFWGSPEPQGSHGNGVMSCWAASPNTRAGS